MKTRNYIHIAYCLILCTVAASCSTTKNLPEGETLYTGIKKTVIANEDKTLAGTNTLEEVNAALACPPNNALLGSSSIRIPFPMGLWIYNDFVKYKKGLGKWIFNKLAAKPVLISTVNPELRTKIATNLLHDYGYFNGTVGYEVIPTKKRQAKINYTIDMQNPYLLDSVMYPGYSIKADSLIRATWNERLLRKGDNFSVVSLEAERQRLSSLFRNHGFFYFRPEFINFRADTLQAPGKVSLKVIPKPGLPPSAVRQWYLGNSSVYITGYKGNVPTDSVEYKGIKIFYSGKRPSVRPAVIYHRFHFEKGDLYSQQKQMDTQEGLNRLGIFRFAEMQYTPRDTASTCNVLDLTINTALDLPLEGELELNVTTKSNDLTGPGAIFSVSKHNFFRGGETFSVKLKGSYEWQTNSEDKSSALNSYELGAEAALDFPRVVFPWVGKRVFNYPATTTFKLYADQLNRPKFFKILAFGGNATYNFQPTQTSKHAITPLKLTFNLLQHRTTRFDSIVQDNRSLELSLANQFIPAMSYTYTYDDAPITTKRNHLWWETSVTSAGNITSAIYAAFGKSFKEKRKNLMGNPFAQFMKLTSEIRYNIKLNSKQNLAMRLMGGVLASYGNAEMNSAPYSEQFYIGGANSIRAFTARGVGPGSYHPAQENKYSYIDQTGNLKLEANIEYRFNILGDLYGATFLDAGNVWLLKEDPARPGGVITGKNFLKEVALGTGVGLRYDLTFLVLRLDMGIALHDPWETGKKGYYNIPRFKDGIGIHLAIGYPF